MISGMNGLEQAGESQANILCKACGLCCTGHLFTWTKLRSAELNSLEALGLKVIRSVPRERGFNQPCPLWKGQCTIYGSTNYPHFCGSYKCALLKKLLDGTTALRDALSLVEQAKEMIQDLEGLLPHSPNPNFRERLAAQMEVLETVKYTARQEDLEFQRKASALLALYEKVFGVKDVVESFPEA
jgi:uncharacterized protein